MEKQSVTYIKMFKKITRAKLDLFLKEHATSDKILDIGSGGSSYDRYFPNRVSVDIDPKRKPDVIADAHNLPFKENEFNFVLSTEVLEHVKDPKTVIAEMKRVLKPRGKLVLTTRFIYPIHDAPHDYWRFTKYGLKELFKDWEILEIIPETKNFSALAVLFQRVAYQTKLHFNIVVKLKLFFFAFVLNHLNWLIKSEYGDIKKEVIEENILTSGYYLVCKKK